MYFAFSKYDYHNTLRVLKGKRRFKCLMILIIFFGFLIFSVRCFSKLSLDWRIRPRCLVSLTFTTGKPLKYIGGWSTFLVLHENNTSFACLLESGLKAISHCLAHWLIFSKSLFSSAAERLKEFYVGFDIFLKVIYVDKKQERTKNRRITEDGTDDAEDTLLQRGTKVGTVRRVCHSPGTTFKST